MAPEPLPLPQRLALNYASPPLRGPATALFTLDARLGELVAKANEPLLAQLRLAWWRDELRKPAADRARGDPVLDSVGESWGGEEKVLSALVDGWESLVGDAPLPEHAIAAFAEGRSGTFAALARLVGRADAIAAARETGTIWALADFAANVTDEEERAVAVRLAGETAPAPGKLPRILRPLAILRGLSRRALARGGGPLVSGRGDILAALRLGMFGR